MKIKRNSGFCLLAVITALLLYILYRPEVDDTFYNVFRNHDGFDWPSKGQAAVGSVEDSVIRCSSKIERLRPTASMAKIITALAVMKKKPIKAGKQGQTFIIRHSDVEKMKAYFSSGCTVLPLTVGMKVTQYEAMQRMLIASDNVMADLLAERIFGSMQGYIRYAQQMVNDMGLARTVVSDASGLSAATVSTPSELVAIGAAALRNRVIRSIVGQKQARLPLAGTIRNTNLLLGAEGVIGIKTGTTSEAGSCLLFAAECLDNDGRKHTLIGVIMGHRSHRALYRDSRLLLISARKYFEKTATHTTQNADATPPGKHQADPEKKHRNL